ncbi:formylmethanofuran dehydrogenase subunit B [Methylothermus subterraneus]|nr:formylmethanofuran dehydrogenase subunit B [uncultured Gammaproteobacteria bacterium]
MARMIEPGVWEHVPSPFCGIGSDDLTIRVQGERVEVLENGDAVTKAGFEQPLGDLRPQLRGQPCSLQEAAAHAAEILKRAELPLVAGLATDVAGMRAALQLAERLGAVVDGMGSEAALRNLLAFQDSGWMTATLSEVRNRADLFVALGVDLEAWSPRFSERHLEADGMFADAASREVVYLGKPPSGSGLKTGKLQVIECAEQDLPEVVAGLRALVNGQPLALNAIGGVAIAELSALAEKLQKARYGVIAWAASALNWPHAELTVQMTCELIKDLNRSTRCVGLPLGGKEGDQTATQVCAWLTGFPTRVRFSRGFPEYDPYLYATERLLARGEVDALLWISAYNCDRLPPPSQVPTIVLGRCGMRFAKAPEVYIPVGVPGIDHAGHTYRMDNVVAIRLPKLREVGLLSVAQVLAIIYQLLE